MSLIQEALRRQREQSSEPATAAGAPTPPPPPSAAAPAPAPVRTGVTAVGARPPPMPVMQTMPEPEPTPGVATAAAPVSEVDPDAKRRPALLLAGMILLVLLLAGGGIGLLYFAYTQWNASKQSQRIAVQRPPVSAPAGAEPAVAAAPGPAAAPETAPAATLPAGPATPETVPTPPAVAAVPPATVVTADAITREGAEPTTPAWPFLKVTGVVGRGLKGAATINGRIVLVGEKIEGAEVVAIGDYGAKLEFQNETRFLKVGSTIE